MGTLESLVPFLVEIGSASTVTTRSTKISLHRLPRSNLDKRLCAAFGENRQLIFGSHVRANKNWAIVWFAHFFQNLLPGSSSKTVILFVLRRILHCAHHFSRARVEEPEPIRDRDSRVVALSAVRPRIFLRPTRKRF